MLRRNALLLLVALAGCGHAPPVDEPKLPSTQELALGPGDTFDVRVYGEPDLTNTYRIAEDGTIDYPLIGQLTVDGLQPHQAASLIEQKLKEKYLRHPQVSILVKDQPSKKINVMGHVNKPGPQSYTPEMNVVDAITNAGGFTAFANRNGTTITRIERGQKQIIDARVKDIVEGKAKNVMLKPGDIVSVPEGII